MRSVLLPFCWIPACLGAIVADGNAQEARPADLKSSVAIENSNAAFTPTDVEIPQANPARPTITIPAHIPPTGYLQLEQGFLHAGSSPEAISHQNALTQTAKIAVTTRLLFQFITEPLAKSASGTSNQGFDTSIDAGDLNLGMQVIAIKSVGVRPTLALDYIGRVRTGAAANLDAGDAAQSFLVQLGGDLPLGVHYDSNLLFNEQKDSRVRRAQFGQTLALSHPILSSALKQRLGGILELSHFTQPLNLTARSGASVSRSNTMDLLFVATFTLRPNLIFDVSLEQGLTSTSTRQQVLVGFTYIVPHRLWPDRNPSAILMKKP